MLSKKGINEWESPDGKRYDVWEFFCLIFVKHKSNNDESRRQKEKRESI